MRSEIFWFISAGENSWVRKEIDNIENKIFKRCGNKDMI